MSNALWSTQIGRPPPNGTPTKRCRSRGTAAIRLGDQPSNVDDLETGGYFEATDHANLLTYRPGIHCQERQVRRTGSIDHRHTTCLRQHRLRD
jgi:hypothetical protein